MVALPSGQIEQLRASFRPNSITTLFVGESAPAGGDFFYLARGQVYRELTTALGLNLKQFSEAGFYLDDLVLEPINWHTRSQRKQMQKQAIPAFAERLKDYQPKHVIAFMKGIREPVQEALDLSGLSCSFHAISFPGNGQQANFRREIAEVLNTVKR